MRRSFSALRVAATVFLGYAAATGDARRGDALSIECLPDIRVHTTSGIEIEIGYTGVTVATSTGGHSPVTISPDPTQPCLLKSGSVANEFCTYTATDSNGKRKSCRIALKIKTNGDGCPSGSNACGDPHMVGLRGQLFNWSGHDGGWYCLLNDDQLDLHINARVTAPLPADFPDRTLITGLSVISGEHSVVVEVADPYSVDTGGCPEGLSPCISNGGLVFSVDGMETAALRQPTRDELVTDGIQVSASNLPVECQQFGGGKIWARMYAEMLQGGRELEVQSFEDWVLSFGGMAAPEWCARFISLHGLAEVQSGYSAFKISTPHAIIRLHTGIDHQGDGEIDWDGRVLPVLDFWQMDVGVEGLSLDNTSMSGLLGETARPVVNDNGREIMEGFEAFRGTAEDYRVSNALGTDFALLH